LDALRCVEEALEVFPDNDQLLHKKLDVMFFASKPEKVREGSEGRGGKGREDGRKADNGCGRERRGTEGTSGTTKKGKGGRRGGRDQGGEKRGSTANAKLQGNYRIL
jgi:hypothetical protein